MKRLYKSDDRIISGVLGGLADYFNVDRSIMRIAFVLLSLILPIGFGMLIFYIIASIIVPERPSGGFRY
ncbi:MAG: PspC domain-containing protein [Tissierellia bacterium]|nr:PspC domain-containing protein [Tissierellia bacterium]